MSLPPLAAEWLEADDGAQREGAYHQGTAWPWLMGAFVDAWLRVNGGDDAHRKEAQRRFVAPLTASRDVRGLGHVSEIADGDPPHTLHGCPFQAWSMGRQRNVPGSKPECECDPHVTKNSADGGRAHRGSLAARAARRRSGDRFPLMRGK